MECPSEQDLQNKLNVIFNSSCVLLYFRALRACFLAGMNTHYTNISNNLARQVDMSAYVLASILLEEWDSSMKFMARRFGWRANPKVHKNPSSEITGSNQQTAKGHGHVGSPTLVRELEAAHHWSLRLYYTNAIGLFNEQQRHFDLPIFKQPAANLSVSLLARSV